jgi:hypothetical protein
MGILQVNFREDPMLWDAGIGRYPTSMAGQRDPTKAQQQERERNKLQDTGARSESPARFHSQGLLRAAYEVCPEGMACESFDLGRIPHVNSDVEAEGDPEPSPLHSLVRGW